MMVRRVLRWDLVGVEEVKESQACWPALRWAVGRRGLDVEDGVLKRAVSLVVVVLSRGSMVDMMRRLLAR